MASKTKEAAPLLALLQLAGWLCLARGVAKATPWRLLHAADEVWLDNPLLTIDLTKLYNQRPGVLHPFPAPLASALVQ
jgi:hypothetical protein